MIMTLGEKLSKLRKEYNYTHINKAKTSIKNEWINYGQNNGIYDKNIPDPTVKSIGGNQN